MTAARVEPLYRDEAYFAALIDVPLREYVSLVAIWERAGFPKKDPQLGKRFAPAVVAWLYKRHGLSDAAPLAPDGEEYPHREPIRRRARA